MLNENGFESLNETLDGINKVIEENIKEDKVVVAIGYSTITEDDKEVHDIFERADRMMYERKKALKAMGAHTR